MLHVNLPAKKVGWNNIKVHLKFGKRHFACCFGHHIKRLKTKPPHTSSN